nr:uncharacterized protein LOC100718363 [Cavia porcellus]
MWARRGLGEGARQGKGRGMREWLRPRAHCCSSETLLRTRRVRGAGSPHRLLCLDLCCPPGAGPTLRTAGAPWSLRAAPALGALSGTGMQRERRFPPGHRAASRGRREQSRGPAASARSAPGSSRRGQLPSPRPFSCLHLSPRAQHCPALGPCRSLRTACPLRCGGPVQSPGPPRPRSALWAGGRVLGEAFLQAAKPYPDQMGGPALGGPGRCH